MARVRRIVGLCGVALLVSGCAGSGAAGGEPVPPFHPGTVTPRENPAAKPPLTDRLWRYAQLFPWKDPFRRFLNAPGGEN